MRQPNTRSLHHRASNFAGFQACNLLVARTELLLGLACTCLEQVARSGKFVLDRLHVTELFGVGAEHGNGIRSNVLHAIAIPPVDPFKLADQFVSWLPLVYSALRLIGGG